MSLIAMGLTYLSWTFYSRLRKARETVCQTRKEYSDLRVENREVQLRELEWEEKVAEMQNELTANEAHNTLLQQQLNRFTEEQQSQQAKIRTTESLFESLDSEVRRWKEESQRLESQLDQASQGTAEKKVGDLRQRLEKVINQRDFIAGQNHDREEIVERLASRTEFLEKTMEENLGLKRRLERKTEALNRTVERLENQLRKSIKRATALEEEKALLEANDGPLPTPSTHQSPKPAGSNGEPIRQFRIQDQVKEDFVIQWARNQFKGVTDRLKNGTDSN